MVLFVAICTLICCLHTASRKNERFVYRADHAVYPALVNIMKNWRSKDVFILQVKIIDFGTAKQLGPGEKVKYWFKFWDKIMLCLPPRMHSLIPLFQVKVLCGTPEFVAPEVVNYDFISTGSGELWHIQKWGAGSGELVRFDLSSN